MGQLCSDECSSASFYLKCEKPYALDAEIRRRFGVLEYLRFKDDIIVIAAGPRERHEPFAESFLHVRDAMSLSSTISAVYVSTC